MKTPSPCHVIIAACLAATGVRAQFPDYPAADLVLGAADFTTVGTGAATPSGMAYPRGLAIDPHTGKLFVSAQVQHRILRFPAAPGLANGADAELVFGQVDFSDTDSGATATTFYVPMGLHVDGSGRLWVADHSNHRVLMFQGAANLPGFGTPADRVFGQPDFTTVSSGTSDSKMKNPRHVFVDAADNLWVADHVNNRILKFANVSTLPSGAAATAVLGQPDFTTATPATSATKMNRPTAVRVDGGGRLWVAENNNHRVLRFDDAASLGNGAPAAGVLGQPDFSTATFGTSSQTMRTPEGLHVDPAGTLYVAEYWNSRVLIFKNAHAKTNGSAADGVIGQPDFTTGTPGTTARKLSFPSGLALDAEGGLWVAENLNHRVVRFPPDRSAAAPKVHGRPPKVTRNAKLTLKGTAADPSGIASVRYRVGKGAFKNAAGTTAWSFKAKLKAGKNKIEIIVVDTLGNTSPAKKVKVKRQ